jgi:LysR family hydrogen peroxide-inducible transcriptional activator
VLTDIGIEVMRRGGRVLSETRDLVDFARHYGRPLTGRLRFGVIPTIAPYLLPRILPAMQRRCPELRVELRESQTKVLLDELIRGALDVVMLALPIAESELEAMPLFEDPFLLAVPAGDPHSESERVSVDDIDRERLILLEEGHCLRDQALAYCGNTLQAGAMGLGATSLATVMQMVANGYGVTLVPEVAVDVEVRDERIKLLRLLPPQPGRTIGLVWRHTSPRKADFIALGQLVTETLGLAPKAAQGVRHKAKA